MANSLFIPLGALNASSAALTAVGNNLANMNTTGYKATTTSFHDVVSQQIGSPSAVSQVGMGVSTPLIRHQFNQGSIQSSSNPFAAAIQGDGFFVIKDAAGNIGYTRAGDFGLDPNGVLIDSAGRAVQGWTAAGGSVNMNGAPGNITIPANALQSPVPTGNFFLNLNLDSGAATGSKFSMPMQVVDSLGKSHTLTVQFAKTGPNAWSYDIQIPGEDVQGGTAGTPQSVGTGNLTFDSSGRLATPAPPPPATNGVVAVKLNSLANGAAAQTINWNLYNADLTPTMTQYAQPSAAAGSRHDGSASAQPINVKLGDNGAITAQYSNGKTVTVAQIALASIRNPESMVAVGNNAFAPGAATVTPSIGAPDTGGRGKIMGGSLEGSTVDIATEFTNLMIFQRSYQASSRVITTMDEVAQETMSLKR